VQDVVTQNRKNRLKYIKYSITTLIQSTLPSEGRSSDDKLSINMVKVGFVESRVGNDWRLDDSMIPSILVGKNLTLEMGR